MKLSEKIISFIKDAMNVRGVDYQYVRDNTDLVDWYHDALQLEKYIAQMNNKPIKLFDNYKLLDVQKKKDGEIFYALEKSVETEGSE